MIDFVVAQSRAMLRAPVDDIFSPVDKSLIEQANKDFFDCIRQSFVHCKTFTLPIAGNAEFAELPNDGAAVLIPPLPHTLYEFFPSEVVPMLAFFGKRLFDGILRGDTRMIRAGNPACLVSGHPLPADKNILKRIVQHVSHR